MADWNPSLYLQYETERSRPAAELLSRVALENVRSVVDLGCGPVTVRHCCISAGPRQRQQESITLLLC